VLAHISSQARDIALKEEAQRSRASRVAEYFPRLAYTTSDVIVMVSREPFFNRRYLDRCIELAKHANSGVTNVQRPALVLVGNKLPGDEVVLDVDASTTRFFECWGEDATELDSFFSAILCVYIPHKNSVWTDPDDPGKVLDGKKACSMQLAKLRNILSLLAKRKLEGSLLDAPTGDDDSPMAAVLPRVSLSQQNGVWFGLLPRVIEEINAGRGVDVGNLLDAAWQEATRNRASEDEGIHDAYRSFVGYMKPPRALSSGAADYAKDVIARYVQFRELVVQVSCRLLACRLRSLERGLLVPSKVREVVTDTMEVVKSMLDSLAPCCVEYDLCEERSTVAVDRPSQPIFCLQEARHHGSHRTCSRVRGGRGIWGTIAFFIPFNDTWPGRHRPPSSDPIDVEACAEQVLCLCKCDDSSFLASLADLRDHFAASSVRLGFASLVTPPDGDWRSRLLPPPATAVSTEAHKRLGLIPGIQCSSSMPYCIGCGLKLTGPSSRSSRTPSTSPSASPPVGLVASIAAALFGVPPPLPDGEDSKQPEVAPSRPALTEAQVIAAATEVLDRPGAVSNPLDGLRQDDMEALIKLVGTASEAEPASPSRGKDSVQHNVWLGVCPRCWDAMYTVPASKDSEPRFVPLPHGEFSSFD
jgi:hypothetical protein